MGRFRPWLPTPRPGSAKRTVDSLDRLQGTSVFPRTSNDGCLRPASWILTRRAHSSGNDQWDRTAEWLSGSGSVRLSKKVGGRATQFGFVRPLERSMHFHAALAQQPSLKLESARILCRRAARIRSTACALRRLGGRRWSWRRPAKPGPGVKAPSMGAFHRPSGFHGRPRRRRPPSGSPSKCSALALHLHGKPPARCRRRPDRTASVWQCASCAERGTSTRRCRLASAGAALRPPSCSDQRAGSHGQKNSVSVWSSRVNTHVRGSLLGHRTMAAFGPQAGF